VCAKNIYFGIKKEGIGKGMLFAVSCFPETQLFDGVSK
jgi:hypothetical protein